LAVVGGTKRRFDETAKRRMYVSDALGKIIVLELVLVLENPHGLFMG
jgi:hypothetical protein